MAGPRSCRGWSSSERPSRLLNRVSEDRGAATVLAAVLVFALLGVTVGGLAVGSVVVARHRAQSGADLAALAAAARVPAGARAACLQAQAVAAAVKVMVRDCQLDGLDVIVSVAAGTGLRIGREAYATARAGPIARG